MSQENVDVVRRQWMPTTTAKTRSTFSIRTRQVDPSARAARYLPGWGSAESDSPLQQRGSAAVENDTWLAPVLVGAAGEAPHAVGLRHPPGQHDHGQIGVDPRRQAVRRAHAIE